MSNTIETILFLAQQAGTPLALNPEDGKFYLFREGREELARLFEEHRAELCANAEEPWEQTRVSMGIATYDPQVDRTADDVTRRADKLMYENKRARKAAD